MSGIPPPREPLQPMDPESMQPEQGARPVAPGGQRKSERSPSTATTAAAMLPLLAASLALIAGLSTEVTPRGSWGSNEMLLSLIAVGAIAAIAGAPLLAMFQAWRPERSTAFKLFLFLGISAAYLVAAAASLALSIVVSFTRDPPEC